jgi:hypothetical protein
VHQRFEAIRHDVGGVAPAKRDTRLDCTSVIVSDEIGTFNAVGPSTPTRQQFVNLTDGVLGDICEHVGEPRLRICDIEIGINMPARCG